MPNEVDKKASATVDQLLEHQARYPKAVVSCQATTVLRATDASPPTTVSPPGRRRVTCCPGRTVDGDPSSPLIYL